MVPVNSAGPMLVRIPEPAAPVASSRPHRTRRAVAASLVGIGAVLAGYVSLNVFVLQPYQNWALEQQMAGRPEATFFDYLRGQPGVEALVTDPDPTLAGSDQNPGGIRTDGLDNGALLGRIEVPRLGLSAIVREGADTEVLRRAVGHIPSTSLPGERGNFAIAAHREGAFHKLAGVRIGDLATFESPDGIYTYRVIAIRIIRPTDVDVLRADGALPPSGGPLMSVSGGAAQLLTMVTCYPLHAFAPATKRLVIQAKLVGISGPFDRRKRI